MHLRWSVYGQDKSLSYKNRRDFLIQSLSISSPSAHLSDLRGLLLFFLTAENGREALRATGS